ncbi:MAG TPA: cupin domain-containing protein [Candidatus Dormibacteraeota bacterium]|nr:cupin domain-containing protein [Candidatus Dormibacteraeota bacterium]
MRRKTAESEVDWPELSGSMEGQVLISGKVKKRSLPTFQPPTQVEGLKRLLLPQGELAQFYDADEAIRYIAFIELKAGTVRGNHFHKTKREWVYLISGEVHLKLQDVETNASDSTTLVGGDLVLIEVGVAHALEVVNSGQAIEFSSVRFDPADVYRFPLS